MSVVKLYLSDANNKHKGWTERVTGTVTLTKDYGRKSYYIQIFDMQYYQQVHLDKIWVLIYLWICIYVIVDYKVWEQELYLEMVYKAPQVWFHSFEADNNMAGLSFADERYVCLFLCSSLKCIT